MNPLVRAADRFHHTSHAIALCLHQSLALGITRSTVPANETFVSPRVGFEWLFPALFLKIVTRYSVRVEPDRASTRSNSATDFASTGSAERLSITRA
jgi:hypothetical protein